MELELAKAIVEQCPHELNLHEDYSGRGMYGRQCAGVSTSDRWESDTYHQAVIEVMQERIEDAIYAADLTEDNMIDAYDATQAAQEAAKKVVEGALNCSTDSMGLGTIWY